MTVDSASVRLWLKWVAANGMGGLAAFAAAGLVIGVGFVGIRSIWPDGSRTALALFVTLAWFSVWPPLAGAGVAAAQWLVLRRWLAGEDLRGWLRTDAILWFVGALLGGVAAYFGLILTRLDPSNEAGLAILACFGLILGFAIALGQWTTFESHSLDAWIWLPAVPIGHAAGADLGVFAAAMVMRDARLDDWSMTFVAAPAIGGLVGGSVSGAITGLALVWLVVRTSSPAPGP